MKNRASNRKNKHLNGAFIGHSRYFVKVRVSLAKMQVFFAVLFLFQSYANLKIIL